MSVHADSSAHFVLPPQDCEMSDAAVDCAQVVHRPVTRSLVRAGLCVYFLCDISICSVVWLPVIHPFRVVSACSALR